MPSDMSWICCFYSESRMLTTAVKQHLETEDVWIHMMRGAICTGGFCICKPEGTQGLASND
eukprot:3016948-Amphidinium_carterae.2